MPTGAGKSAGRVSVRVVPDSTGFRSELKADLDKIERGLEVSVKAALDDTALKASLEKLKQTKIDLEATVSTTQVRQQIKSVSNAGGKVEIPVSLSGANIVRAELIRLATNRVIDLVVNVNKRSLVAAGTALASLSGGKSAVGYLRGIGSALGGLDKSIPRIALLATTIGAVGAASFASLSGALSLASGLLAVSGAAVALPGLLAGLGVAGGTLAIALKNAGDQLGNLTPKFTDFQLAISKDFFSKAEGPIRDLVNSALPALESGLGKVSSSLGGFAATAATAFQGLIKRGDLSPLFNNTAKAIDNAKAAIQPLLSAFSTLVTVGSSYLPALGSAISDVAGRFDTFIQSAATDGSLTDWINTGLDALKSLGSVVSSVAGILKGLFTAAEAATSGNGLAVFAQGLKDISDAINSTGLQTALTTIFTGAQEGAAGLASAIKPIGGLLSELAPTISGVFATAGSVIGGALSAIASALSDPAFAEGLTGFFAGIATGVNAVLPVLPAIVSALSTVASTAGMVAAQLGPVFAASFAALAPVITQVLTALQPLIPVLGQALADSVSILAASLVVLAPIFSAIISAVAPLIPILAGALAGALATLGPAVLTVVQALGGALPSVIAAITSTVAVLAPVLAQVITSLAPLVPVILSLIPPLLQLVTAILPLIPQVVALIVPLVAQLVPIIIQIITAIMPLVPTLIQLVVAVLQFAAAIQGGVFAALSLLAGILPTIVAAINATLTVIIAFVQGAVAAFTGNFAAIPGIVSGAMGRVVGFISSGLASAGGVISSFVSRGIGLIVSFGAGIVSAVSSALSSFVGKITTAITQAVTVIGSLPGKAKSALGNLAGLFVSVGGDIIRGIIQGIGNGVGALVGAITSAAKSALNAAKGALGINSPSTVFRDEVGRHIPTGIVEGIKSSQGVLDSALGNMVNPALAGLSAARVTSPSLAVGAAGASDRSITIGQINGTDHRALIAALLVELRLQEANSAATGWR